MADRLLSGTRALVTGASSGIGAAIARRLAVRGAALVLAARRRDRMEALAGELRSSAGVTVDVVEVDLTAPGATRALWQAATAGGTIEILINNAGFGMMRPFGAVDLEREHAMLQLNILSLVELTHHFVNDVLGRAPRPARAHVLNVASLAAWQALPWFASYAASKAFVRDFSEAIHYELKPQGVAVTCLCPGGTRTEFHELAGAGNYGWLANRSLLSAERVAELGVRAMLRGKKTIVPGVLNNIARFLTSLSPRGLASRTAVLLMGGPRRGALPPPRAPGEAPAP